MKWISLVIGLVLSFAFVSGVRAANGKWKTLENKYGYSFEIPETWGFTDDDPDNRPPSDRRVVSIDAPANASTEDRRVEIHIIYRPADQVKGRTPKDFISHPNADPEVEQVQEGPFTLGGEVGYQVYTYSHNVRAPTPLTRLLSVNHHGANIEFHILELGKGAQRIFSPKDWKYGKEVDQMIASFKFTK